MDIYDYLKMDHKKVAKLFDLYETAISDRNRLEIFEMIKKELIVHADSESATFYKALEKSIKSQNEAWHGEQEHEEIKEMLFEISQLETVDKDMNERVAQLKELVEHHVSDEEGRMFSAAKKILSDHDAWILKVKMHDYKETILAKESQDELEKIE